MLMFAHVASNQQVLALMVQIARVGMFDLRSVFQAIKV
jgi:hypothetical protein